MKKGILEGGTEIDNNKELFKEKKITEIVSMIEYDGNHFLTIGMYRISEMKKTEEELERWINDNVLSLICNISTIISKLTLKKEGI